MLKNEIMAHCRLCLVKDDVNIAIFDNLQEICQKISSCLPVKVSKDDKLPKKICDGCNLKLEQFYEFVTASVQAERQLLEWLKDEASASSKADVRVKEELFEQQNAFEETVQAEYVDFKTKHTEDSAKEPPRKRARKAAVKVKPTLSQETDEEDDDLDTVAKVEDESADNSEQEESYEEVPGTSADDQPGPSGLSKGESEAPLLKETVSGRKRFGRTPKSLEDQCRLCGDRPKDLRAHYKEAHPEHRGPYRCKQRSAKHECDICGKICRTRTCLRDHIETHNNYFVCAHCDSVHRKLSDHVLHLRSHSAEGVFNCLLCGLNTPDLNTISAHLLTHTNDKNPYWCEVCRKGFPLLEWFNEHENIHKDVRPFNCSDCGKSFAYSRYLHAHKNALHSAVKQEDDVVLPTLHECVICNKVYQHKNSLKLHMNCHTGNYAICDICGKILSSTEKLKFHYRTHTGFKPFKCAFCDKSFTRKSILTEHTRVHTGERPYVCEYCSRGFSQRSSLVIHIRYHTGERPFPCHFCGKAFAAKAMLTVHLKACKGG